ncbi:MAG: tRNA uridine-5-carboxymethylaminomethyl(34) synthesis GTPase MnmE, partial [Granulosicoccaceae bacterium]
LLKVAGRDDSIEGVFLARRRHLHALNVAQEACANALKRLQENQMPELAAEELKLAQQALNEITGQFDADDLLGRIFADFCVGK